MKRTTGIVCLAALFCLFLFGCEQQEKRDPPDEPYETPQQEETEGKGQEREESPALISIPTGEERMDYLLNHSEEERAAYQEQLYALLDQCTAQQICDGLKGELETWSAGVETAVFTQAEANYSQDPLMMWSGGDKRQYRNITATIRLFYDPSAVQGEEKQTMESLLEEAQQTIRQSPYGLKLVSAELIFVDKETGYPGYSIGQVSVGVPGKNDPSPPISPEEQRLQTLAYEKIAAFCRQEFAGARFEGLPYANMTLSRFGAAEGSQTLECEARIEEAGDEDSQLFAQKLEELARQLADEWREDGEALKALGVTQGRVSFDLRYSPDSPLVYEFALGAA